MPDIMINYWAVLTAGVSAMVVGFLWYGPLFGKQWMKLMGFSKDNMKGMKMTANQSYAVAFVAALLTAYVLAHFIVYTGGTDAAGGMRAAFWIWLGFVATTQLGIVLWENKPPKLFAINASQSLASLLAMGAIIGAMR